MSRVKLCEVAREYKESWKGSKIGVPIVGLEHLIPEELLFNDYEVDTDNTFSKSFKKGHVLFGRRRAYQKKAALATIDGICSGDITVIEAIPGKIDANLLPFIIQNADFFNYAISGSAGSLSPRVKWEHLADFEFDLPSLSEQQVLAEKLWAAYNLKESYKKMIEATDEMVKSRFIEMFGKPKAYRQDISIVPLSSVVSITNGYAFNAELFTDNCSLMPLVRIRDIVRGFTETYTGEQCDDKYIIHNGDLLVGMDGDFCVNKWKSDDALLNQRVCKLKGKEGMIDDTYLLFFLTPELKAIQDKTLGTTVKHLSSKTIGDLSLPMPDYAVQEQFSAIVQQADKSKFELREAIKRVESMMKSLMNS